MSLVDTHCHLHFPDFQNDLEAVIDRAKLSGVRSMINVGTDLESSKQSVALAEQYDFVHAAAGIHPHDAGTATPEDLCQIAGLLKHPKIVAIGEVGLDYFRNLSTAEAQIKILVQFFDLSKQHGLPLILHIRDAYDDVIGLLKAHFKPPIRAVSHCFSSNRETMEKLLELGLFISFAGPVTYKKNDPLREAAQTCPLDRIMIETDAPFLAPQLHRGKRNEPSYLIETAKKIAEVKGISLDELAQASSRNCETLFRRTFKP